MNGFFYGRYFITVLIHLMHIFSKMLSGKLLVLLEIFTCACSYRILGVFPFPGRSHFFLGSTLMKGIAEAGHDVTIIAPYKDEHPPDLYKNGSYRVIVLEELEGILHKKVMKNGKMDKNLLVKNNGGINAMNRMLPLLGSMSEEALKTQKLTNLIMSNEKFDVVIVTEFLTDLLKLLAHQFDASLVLFANNAKFTWYYDDIGYIALPSIQPAYPVEMPHQMSFSQRLENLVERIGMFIIMRSFFSQQEKIGAKYFPNAPSLQQVRKNVSLVLINTHYSTELPRQTTPTMIDVGGFHIKSLKKLPKDLQDIMDNAKNGVIFFSFGSVIDPELISVEKLQEVLDMLGERKEIVLWKFNGELKNKPKNVHFGKWFPQQEILAHPNTKLFITHSGYSSTTETIYFGVPTISVPFMADQPAHARFLVETGSGLMVNVENFGADTIREAVEEIIANHTYREAAQKQSRIMRDRQNKPMDDAIFWIEYVARHKGAKHLRVPHIDMPLYEAYMLDILGLLVIGLVIISILLTYISMKVAMYISNRLNKHVSSKSSEKKRN